MQLGVQPALRATDQTAPLVAGSPFFDRRLVAVRCALRYVASIITVFGTAASAASPSIIRAKTPLSLHRFPAVVEGLGRAILLRRIPPTQAVAIDEDYPAQHPPVVDAGLAMRLREEGLEARYLRLGQPEEVAHVTARFFKP
jgi:hypothetical protein